MGHFGKPIRSSHPRRQHGQAYEELDLSGMRSPGAVYHEPRPARPHEDPLLYTETAYPRAPEPYREDPRYHVLDRRSYQRPGEYEPEEPDWEYDRGPRQAMFDGRALNSLDRQQREQPLTYEESVRRLSAAAAQGAYPVRDGLVGGLEPLGPASHGGDEFFTDSAAPTDVAGGPEDLGAIDALTDAPGTMPEEEAYGGLEQIMLGQELPGEPAGPDPWASMAMDDSEDDAAAAEHAFDRQLEDIASEFQRQEQAFAEPDWGAGAPSPGFEPPDPFMQPPGPPGPEGFPL